MKRLLISLWMCAGLLAAQTVINGTRTFQLDGIGTTSTPAVSLSNSTA